jgi:hypothetical protein
VRTVTVTPPSFPEVVPDQLLDPVAGRLWQVLCGDGGHWRAGLWSPAATCAGDCPELEQHTCPELFLLIDGRITLLLHDGDGVRELPLEPGRPVLVTRPHSGFCPDGPHCGRAFVVERDAFSTGYRAPEAWGR